MKILKKKDEQLIEKALAGIMAVSVAIGKEENQDWGLFLAKFVSVISDVCSLNADEILSIADDLLEKLEVEDEQESEKQNSQEVKKIENIKKSLEETRNKFRKESAEHLREHLRSLPAIPRLEAISIMESVIKEEKPIAMKEAQEYVLKILS